MAIDNSWTADIEFRIESARTVAELERIQDELNDVAATAGTSSEAFNDLRDKVSSAMDAAANKVGTVTAQMTSDLNSWKAQFQDEIVLGFASGDSSGGLERMEALIRRNKTEVEDFIAAHKTLNTTAVQAYNAVTSEMARQETALQRLNQAQSDRNIAKYTADMSQLEKASFNLTRATTELAAAEKELANTPTTASTGDLSAARNRVADATKQVTAAEVAWDQALKKTESSYQAMDAAIKSYQRTMAEQESGLSEAALAAAKFEQAQTKAAAAVDKAKAAYDGEDLRNMDKYAREAAQAVKELESAYVTNTRAQAREAEELEQSQKRLADSYENLKQAGKELDTDRVTLAQERLTAATKESEAAFKSYQAVAGSDNTQEIIAARNRLADANDELAASSRELEAAQDSVTQTEERHRYAMYEVGTTYIAVAASITAAGVAVLKASADIETGMIGIQRTSNATDAQMGILNDRMIDLIQTMPVTSEEILAMAERAGQLGLSAGDIDSFTESALKLVAVSDTLSATEAAEYLGRIANLTGMKDVAGGFDMIADSIASAGVNAAATDQQIAKTAQEVAMAAAGANFAADEIIGLATAFASLGVPPERARSVIQNLVTTMNKGMRGASDSVENAAKALGITADEAARLWTNDPTEFINQLAQALSGLSGPEIGRVLSDIGLEGMRAVPVFQALAKDAKSAAEAGEGFKSVFESSIDMASFETAAGTLDEMFAPVLESLNGKFQLFQNAVLVAAAAIGGTLAPVAIALLDVVTPLINAFADFAQSPAGPWVIGIAAGITGLIGVVAALRGGLALATAAAMAFRQTMSTAIGMPVTAQFKMLLGTVGQITGATNMATGAMARFGTTAATAGSKSTVAMSGLQAGIGRVRGAASGALAMVGGWPTLILAAASAVPFLIEEWDRAGLSVEEMTEQVAKLYEGTTDLVTVLKANSSSLDEFFGMGAEAVDTYSGSLENLIPLLDDYAVALDGAPVDRIEELNAALDGVSTQEIENLLKDFKDLDEQLGQMSFNDMAMGFASVVDASDGSRESLLALIDTFEDVRNSAQQQYLLEYGVELDMADAEDRLKIVEFLMYKAQGAAVGLTGSFTEAELAAEEAAAEIDNLADALKGYNDEVWAAGDAQIKFNNALRDLNEAGAEGSLVWDEVGNDFDFLTEAGQKTYGLFQDMTQAAYDNAAAMLANGSSIDDVTAYLQDARQAFYDQALAMTGSAEAAQELTDKYFGFPPVVITEMLTNGTFDASLAKTEDLMEALSALPPDTTVQVTGLTADAKKKIQDLGYTVTEVADGVYEITVSADTTAAGNAVKGLIEKIQSDGTAIYIPTYILPPTGGYKRGQADGGYVYASGGHAGYASGGQVGYYTGQGGKWDPAGIVHRGEYVIPKWGVDQSTGLPKADILGRLTKGSPSAGRDRGYAGGGLVTGAMDGIVDLGPATIQQLARVLQPHLTLDGKMVAENSANHYQQSNRVGAN